MQFPEKREVYQPKTLDENMEQKDRESVLRHNALMDAAYWLVMRANGYCKTIESERIETELEMYEICADTGALKTDA